MRILIVAVFVLLPTLAMAQETTELSDVQRAYNEEGLKYAIAGKHAEALAKFQNSLTLGEANVTWLNIARSQQKLGRCMEAKEAYGRVPSAPAVESPPPEDIATFVRKYEAELPEVCPATLKVTVCTYNVSLGGGEEQVCPTEFTGLPPGEVTLSVSLGQGQREDQTFTLAEGEIKEVAIDVPERDMRPKLETHVNSAPIMVSSLGAALLLTALAVDLALVGPAVDDANASDGQADHQELYDKADSLMLMNKVVIGAGSLALVSGVVWWMVAPTIESEPVVIVGADSAQAGWRWSW